MKPAEDGGLVAANLNDAIKLLESMIEAAKAYVRASPDWSERARQDTEEGKVPEGLGLYFHCYPSQSVNALHMHMVDIDNAGPTFKALAYKNLSATDALDVSSCDASNTWRVPLVHIFGHAHAHNAPAALTPAVPPHAPPVLARALTQQLQHFVCSLPDAQSGIRR